MIHKLDTGPIFATALIPPLSIFVSCSVEIDPSEHFLHGGGLPTLVVKSTGHAVHVFVNGEHIGTVKSDLLRD